MFSKNPTGMLDTNQLEHNEGPILSRILVQKSLVPFRYPLEPTSKNSHEKQHKCKVKRKRNAHSGQLYKAHAMTMLTQRQS